MSDTSVFRCTRCGECCQGQGGIVVALEQVIPMALHLGRAVEAFIDEALALDRGLLTIREGSDGRCVLWRDGCGVHPVKPDPCRAWPFFKAIVESPLDWAIARNNCPGLAHDHTYEAFHREGHLLAWDAAHLERYRIPGVDSLDDVKALLRGKEGSP